MRNGLLNGTNVINLMLTCEEEVTQKKVPLQTIVAKKVVSGHIRSTKKR